MIVYNFPVFVVQRSRELSFLVGFLKYAHLQRGTWTALPNITAFIENISAHSHLVLSSSVWQSASTRGQGQNRVWRKWQKELAGKEVAVGNDGLLQLVDCVLEEYFAKLKFSKSSFSKMLKYSRISWKQLLYLWIVDHFSWWQSRNRDRNWSNRSKKRSATSMPKNAFHFESQLTSLWNWDWFAQNSRLGWDRKFYNSRLEGLEEVPWHWQPHLTSC